MYISYLLLLTIHCMYFSNKQEQQLYNLLWYSMLNRPFPYCTNTVLYLCTVCFAPWRAQPATLQRRDLIGRDLGADRWIFKNKNMDFEITNVDKVCFGQSVYVFYALMWTDPNCFADTYNIKACNIWINNRLVCADLVQNI